MFEKFGHTNKINPATVIALSFLIVILIGTALLSLPIATRSGHIRLVDALFTATSATCVTGLIVVDTGQYFTLFGQLVIMFLFQIGGLGIMTFSTFFAVLLGRRMSMKDKLIMQDALDYFELGSIGKLIIRILVVTISIEMLGTIPLFFRWQLTMPAPQALYYAIFHSISAFCNAGFSLFSDNLLAYQSDPIINLDMISLIIMGGIGFIVLLDIAKSFLLKLKKKQWRLSMQTKVVLSTSAGLIISGCLLIFLLEKNNSLALLCGKNKLLTALFQAVTCRTAGFNTLNIGSLATDTLAIIIILMFIGASPSSTGGGIKTTTFTIFIATLRAMTYGREDVHLFKRTIPRKIIHKVAVIIGLSTLLVILASIILILSERNQTFAPQRGYPVRILFEVVSAFGTVGLSTGITDQLSSIGRLLITLVMYVGRIGPLTLALAIGKTKPPPSIKYPEGKITVG